MMKKLSLIAVLLLALCLVFPALADDTPTYTIGDGDTEILVIVAVLEELDAKFNFFINTDERYLMDALVNIGLIEVEKASWGYYVSTVLEVEAEGSHYWSILTHNGDEFVDLSTPIDNTRIYDDDVFAFLLI